MWYFATHGKSMDVIDFILNKENCTKHEAINKAKEILNHNIKKTKLITTWRSEDCS